jgi:IrrE N-terminal-like domain
MTLPAHFRDAPDLLRELGISEPKEIDVAAIAYHCGAMVIERPLSGCEARIIGVNDRAIITVNANSMAQRRRFSAAHELGHWMRDAGQVAFGCNPDAVLGKDEFNPETRANQYASNLLLPKFMFEPRASKKPATFATVQELAGTFDTSLTATAIRLVDYGSYPAMLVCSDSRGIRWCCRGAEVPKNMRPSAAGRMTYTNEVLKGGTANAGQVNSDQWFASVKRHSLHEDARRISDELVLSLLWWDDEDPLIEIQEEQEQRDYRRSDWRDDD